MVDLVEPKVNKMVLNLLVIWLVYEQSPILLNAINPACLTLLTADDLEGKQRNAYIFLLPWPCGLLCLLACVH